MFGLVKDALVEILKKSEARAQVAELRSRIGPAGVKVIAVDSNGKDLSLDEKTALMRHFCNYENRVRFAAIDVNDAKAVKKASEWQAEFDERSGVTAAAQPQPNSKPSAPLPVNPQPAIKPQAQPAVEKLRWKVEGKTLTVGGVREIKNYSYEQTPWRDSLDIIQKVVIEEGVEKISANAFIDCRHLEQLTIPASIKTIEDFAFNFCYCGDRKINNGKNVIWLLDEGILKLKKNPAAKSDADFSTGFETWHIVEKNIQGIEIERGVVLGKRFFDWLNQLSVKVPVQIS